jgi:ADP-ribose pyrophosphatase YjhB (NUDIX family)
MALSWDESYLGQLRALAGGERVLIMVGARCVLRDAEGQVLLIKRSDNGAWALPAGAMELGENLRACAIREMREETGLVASAITPFALYSQPQTYGPNMYGHTYQYITLACRVDSYEGDLVRETDETTDAGYFRRDALPESAGASVRRTLNDLEAFEAGGSFTLD